MRAALDTLAKLDIPCETLILSAHRTPDETLAYAAAMRMVEAEVY